MTVLEPKSPVNRVAHTIVSVLQHTPTGEMHRTIMKQLVRSRLQCSGAVFDRGFDRAVEIQWVTRHSAVETGSVAVVRIALAGRHAGVWHTTRSPYRDV